VGLYLKSATARSRCGASTPTVGVQEVQGDRHLRQERDLPYITEGIGEDFLPKNVDFRVIDHFEKVTDKDAAIMTRRIAREEGSSPATPAGSAMAGLLQLRDRSKTRT
jgi:cysteine synthase